MKEHHQASVSTAGSWQRIKETDPATCKWLSAFVRQQQLRKRRKGSTATCQACLTGRRFPFVCGCTWADAVKYARWHCRWDCWAWLASKSTHVASRLTLAQSMPQHSSSGQLGRKSVVSRQQRPRTKSVLLDWPALLQVWTACTRNELRIDKNSSRKHCFDCCAAGVCPEGRARHLADSQGDVGRRAFVRLSQTRSKTYPACQLHEATWKLGCNHPTTVKVAKEL